MLRTRDIMTSDVLTLRPDTSIREAAEILSDERVGGAPVVDHGTLIGILTAQDILDFVATLATETAEVRTRGEQGILDDHEVEEAMSRVPIRTVSPDTPVEMAAELLAVERLHRLPVVEEGRLVGIVSTVDIVRAVADRRISHRTLVFPTPSTGG